MKRSILTLLLLLLFSSSCLAEMISIIHQPAELRNQPMISGSKVLRNLPRYTPLQLLEKKGEYYQVKDINGSVGYVHRSLTSDRHGLIVTVDLANVRTGPDKGQPVVFKARMGDCFAVLGQQGEWIQIAKDGENGWLWQGLGWGY